MTSAIQVEGAAIQVEGAAIQVEGANPRLTAYSVSG